MHCMLYVDMSGQLFSEICDITSHFQTLMPDDQILNTMYDYEDYIRLSIYIAVQHTKQTQVYYFAIRQ